MRLTTCGCCETPGPSTPERIWNRHGLSSLAYRIGTFATFRQAMLTGISRQAELSALRSRASDDYAITLLEHWAVVCDILTFYQERIASEAFLRTALHRQSIQRLARFLDYELSPGIAAAALLAFDLREDTTLTLPVGLRVQSVPSDGKLPQKFETVQPLQAHAWLNRLQIFPSPVSYRALGTGSRSGDLRSANNVTTKLKAGQRLIMFSLQDLIYRFHFDHTASSLPAAAIAELNAALDVIQAAPAANVQVTGHTDTAFDPEESLVRSERRAHQVRSWFEAQGVEAGRVTTFGAGSTVPINDNSTEAGRWSNRRIEIVVTGIRPLVEERRIESIENVYKRKRITWNRPLMIERHRCRPFTRKFRLFGLHAPERYPVLSNDRVPIWKLVDTKFEHNVTSEKSELHLDTIYDDLDIGTEILVSIESVTNPQLLARTVRQIGVETVRRGLLSEAVTRLGLNQDLPGDFDIRHATIYEFAGPELEFWTYRYPDALRSSTIFLQNIPDKPSLLSNRRVFIGDERGAPMVATLSVAGAVDLDGDGHDDHLALDVIPALDRPLATASAYCLANVAEATHGETVRGEILGDGDATAEFQRFELRRKRLTYVPSARAGGVESSLSLFVNGVRWQEVPTLFGRRENETVYTTRTEDDGTTVVEFGGKGMGARLPSGRGNIAANYRQGLGLEGRLQAHALRTLLDRPLGMNAATNPLPTEGGADAQTLATARNDAPKTVRTFGRAVSLLDFADLITGREVAKARATWIWHREQRAVHVTVAGQEGSIFSRQALARLHASLGEQRDPNYPLLVDNYARIAIVVNAMLLIQDQYVAREVEAAARKALLDALSFEVLSFGQPLHLSDVFHALQSVEGIEAVDIDRFHFKDRSSTHLATRGTTAEPVQDHLRIYPARPPVTPSGSARPAEQAWVATPANDIVLHTRGGLPE